LAHGSPLLASFPIRTLAIAFSSSKKCSLVQSIGIADNGSLVTDLFFAMESLAESEGWPQQGTYCQPAYLVIWQILNHLVVYQRFVNQQVAQIALIKPD
jgi:hypothetical protein